MAATAAGVGLRWTVTRVDSLGRTRPFPAISVIVAALGALVCAVPVLLSARLEHRLTAAASDVVGSAVEVHCLTLGQTWLEAHAELGYVLIRPDGRPEHRAVIARQACEDLRSWLQSDRRNPSRDQVIAVHVLTHEAMHMAGVVDEAQAECLAVQRDAQLAQALGGTAQQAGELAFRYWREVYPQMPDSYWSAECRPGGALDDGLPYAPWRQ